jgi:exodeoxyribonuclease V beta subunit
LAPPDYEAARRAARPTFTTSYTHLSGLVKRRAEDPGEDLGRHGEQDQPSLPLAQGELPGGPVAGQAMHSLLEELDLDAAAAGSFEAFWTPARQAWARAVLARHGFDAAFTEPAARRAFLAVRAPLPSARGGAAPLTVHDPGRLARELDFLASYFDTPDFLNGAMDAVFQRDGLTYILDWKNDRLASYGPEALDAHIRHRYAIQVKLYTWVVLRWLRLDTEAEYEAGFGGLHYVFLRGLPAEGVWYHRPTWAEVGTWREDLMRLHGEVAHG